MTDEEWRNAVEFTRAVKRRPCDPAVTEEVPATRRFGSSMRPRGACCLPARTVIRVPEHLCEWASISGCRTGIGGGGARCDLPSPSLL